MTDKITELTPEQIATFPHYVDKWTKIGLSTEPLDFENAKEATIRAYEAVGLKPPVNFYEADSPVHAIKVIQGLYPDQTPSQIFSDMSYGSHDAPWLGYYNFFQEQLNVESCNSLQGLMDLAKYCGWVSFYEDTVVFQHRPISIKMDDQNRLHNEFGPAIEYKDGTGIYSWHGVTIPDEWITMKSSLTPKIALTWENIEQRRCACEILGWARIIRELNARVIDSDPDPQIGNLLEVDLPDIGKEKFLQVLCGTRRTFAIPIPPHIETALAAQAWTYGMSEEEFGTGPEIRT